MHALVNLVCAATYASTWESVPSLPQQAMHVGCLPDAWVVWWKVMDAAESRTHATTAAWTQTYLLLTWPHICTETTDFLNVLYLALTLPAISVLLMPIPAALWLDLAMQIRWAGPAVSRKGVSWSSWNALLEIAEIGRLKMRHPDCCVVVVFFFLQHPTHSHTRHENSSSNCSYYVSVVRAVAVLVLIDMLPLGWLFDLSHQWLNDETCKK